MDKNGVEVMFEEDLRQIGYIACETAAKLAPFIESFSYNDKVKLKAEIVEVIDSMEGVVNVSFEWHDASISCETEDCIKNSLLNL